MRETHEVVEMDVSFTNVLEGARQYFQGLPAASESSEQPPGAEPQVGGGAPGAGSAGGVPPSAYPTYVSAPSQQQHQAYAPAAEPQAAAPQGYWLADKPAAHHDPGGDQRPKQQPTYAHSQQPYWTAEDRPKTHERLQTNHAQDASKIMPNYHYVQQTSSSYQYSRAPVESQMHHSYTNVAQPNMHQVSTIPQTSRASSTPTSKSYQQLETIKQAQSHSENIYVNGYPQRSQETVVSKNYQQLQAPKQSIPSSHAESMYVNGYAQNNMYYPSSSKAQSPAAAQPPSNQGYNQTQNSQYASYSHSQSPVQTQTQYLSTKVVPEHYENKNDMLMTHQSNRKTHNLPPIAALSSVNYHSNKSSRENVQKTAAVPNRQSYAPVPRSANSLMPASTVPSTIYSNSQQQSRPSAIYTHQSRSNSFSSVVPNANSSQVRYSSGNSEQSYQYPVASSSYGSASAANVASNSSKQMVYSQSSYPQYFQKSSKVENQTLTSNQSLTANQNIPAPNQNMPANHQNMMLNQKLKDVHRAGEHSMVGVSNQHRTQMTSVLDAITSKHKRESPLDLSVKTVRTSADSTALDDSEGHDQRFGKGFKSRLDNKYMYQTVQTPANGSYVVKDNQNIAYQHQRSTIRSTNVPTSGAPKVDFLPNFSASALHGQNHERQQQSFQQYNRTSENTVNQNSLTRNATQEYYQRTNSYQQVPAMNHKTSSSGVKYNTLGSNTYQINQTNDNKVETLPRFELPIEQSVYKKASYPNAHDIGRKRLSESPSVVPNKVAKIETWRQTIDQQIEQKLSSYTNSRLQEHQTYKQQIVNQFVKPTVNNVNQKSAYTGQYYQQTPQTYRSNNHYPSESHTSNQNHQYASEVNQQYPSNNVNTNQYDIYVQNPLHRSNSSSKLVSPKTNNVSGVADKRILSILRNSLEIKGAKEAQKKLEQMKPNVPVNAQTGVQYPPTDVAAPLQPKPSIHSRHNVSPFTAPSLERNSNTPPNYKIHFPRAVDSIKFESDTVIKNEVPHDNIQTTPIEEIKEIVALNDTTTSVPTNTGSESLDGLAAFLAARIRTKGERKQVPEKVPESASTDKSIPVINAVNNQICNTSIASSPPKLSREPNMIPPRRKLFTKSEDEQNIPAPINGGSAMPHRNTLRSSSETSVFDFRDSDSEGEMPILERQSLDDMRRDRKSLNRNLHTPLLNDSMNNVVKNEEPEDPDWAEMCSNFCEQLQAVGKKRGRRKKMVEPEDIARLENVTKEHPLENEIENVVIKQEVEDEPVIKKEPELLEEETELLERGGLGQLVEKEPDLLEKELELLGKGPELFEKEPEKLSELLQKEIKKEIIEEPQTSVNADDSDSDVPLNSIKLSIKKEDVLSDDEAPILKKKTDKIGAKTRIEYSSDSDSDTNVNAEKIDSVARNLFNKRTKKNEKERNEKGKMVLRSADSSPIKKAPVNYIKKKSIFGDGSDFHPGWEEEVYKYKRSIRMPARLINVTRPHWHRMSTSLPDLDACSPAPSSLTDDTDFTINQSRSLNSSLESKKLKRDILDSDSNSSFSFQRNAYDSEEASCSSLRMAARREEAKNSILDVLIERYGKFKKRRNKSKESKNGPKIIEKSSNLLLPTPSLGIGNADEQKGKKKGKTKTKEKEEEKESTERNSNSVYLGFFRKETVNNFRDQFKKNSGGILGMGEPFSTIVLKSRTRTETRVMKQRATIREVFGEDRPASAPPMSCCENDEELKVEKTALESTKSEEKEDKAETDTKDDQKEAKSAIREGLRSATSPVKKTYHLKRKYTFKTINSETNSVASTDEQVTVKSETPSLNGDETSDNSIVPIKRKYKLTKIRRKFSSGFDYIRKKKKIIKKEGSDVDIALKQKRRLIVPRQNPESEEDIQREIKTWVLNKGVGETHLHRAARLGYSVSAFLF